MLQVMPVSGALTPAFRCRISASDLINLAKVIDNPYKLFGAPGTIFIDHARGWRIDNEGDLERQTVTEIQIQKNDVSRPSTAACLLIPRELYRSNPKSPGPAQQKFDLLQAEFKRIVAKGLTQSAASHTRNPKNAQRYAVQVFRVIGQYSNESQSSTSR